MYRQAHPASIELEIRLLERVPGGGMRSPGQRSHVNATVWRDSAGSCAQLSAISQSRNRADPEWCRSAVQRARLWDRRMLYADSGVRGQVL